MKVCYTSRVERFNNFVYGRLLVQKNPCFFFFCWKSWNCFFKLRKGGKRALEKPFLLVEDPFCWRQKGLVYKFFVAVDVVQYHFEKCSYQNALIFFSKFNIISVINPSKIPWLAKMHFTHNYFFFSRSLKMLVKYTDFHVFSFIVHWIASATTRTCPSSFFEWILQSFDMQTIISEAIFTYTIYELLIALEWAFGDDCDSIKKKPNKKTITPIVFQAAPVKESAESLCWKASTGRVNGCFLRVYQMTKDGSGQVNKENV